MTCNIGRQHPGDWRTRAWRATLMRREVLLALDSELAQTNRGGTVTNTTALSALSRSPQPAIGRYKSSDTARRAARRPRAVSIQPHE